MSQEKEVADRIADWNIANEFRLGQVQGFGYGADGLHLVIRDCWLKPNEQTVWERHATLETHATDHAEMMRQIEVYRLALALRETAALAEPGDGWESMDSAPRDGTPILITRPTQFPAEEGCHVVRWSDDWWVCHDGKFDTPLRGGDPTHWRPRPSPPRTPSPGDTGE